MTPAPLTPHAKLKADVLASKPNTYITVAETSTRLRRLSCGRVFVEYPAGGSRRVKTYPAHRLDVAVTFALDPSGSGIL
jgi:hypothetical protein